MRALLLVVALSGTVFAEGGAEPKDTYWEAIKAAVTAFDASDFGAARAAFERAHALSPNARTFRGIGVAAFAQGDFVAAGAALREALADVRKPLTAEQRAEASELLTQSEQHLGHVTVVAVPARAAVRMDGQPVDATAELTTRTGPHVFRAELDGYTPTEQRVQLVPGAHATVHLELTAAPAPGDTAPPVAPPRHREAPVSPDATALETPAPSRGRLWTWVALGAAPVFGGVGLGIWLSGLPDARDIKNDCTGCTDAAREHLKDAKGLNWKETWATVGGIAAGAAAGAAVVLYFVEGPSAEANGRTVTVGVSGSYAYARSTF